MPHPCITFRLIEYWGYENQEKYLARKKQKIAIYEKYGFNLVELGEKEVQNLDDHLPRALLKFGIQAYWSALKSQKIA